MARSTLTERLAGSRAGRALADAALVRYARRRVRFLDTKDPAELQRRTLLKLVKHAADTRFGRDHDFRHVRTVGDFQQRVPLRDYEAFWADYWQPAFPNLAGVTWPGRVPYFAESSGTTSGKTKHIPVTRPMVASNRKAAFTLTALFVAAHPTAHLLHGRTFLLGGSTALRPLPNGALCGDLSGIASHRIPPTLRPFVYPPTDLALLDDWEKKVDVLAEKSVRLPVTMISGVPAWLLTFFDRLMKVAGKSKVADVWPTLRVVVHGGCRFDPYRAVFDDILGDGIHLLDTYPASEGYVATADPRHDRLRLIPDHGVFFEFVPTEELGTANPTRHTVANLEPGQQYAVALSTCAGLWAYLLGDTVCFDRRDPPLLRFTGRTKYMLSAFGEHLISDEVERAITAAADATGAAVRDFHVGPVFPPDATTPGHHRFLVEFARPPADPSAFARQLDVALQSVNNSFAAYRVGDVSLKPPEVVAVAAGGFAGWMKSKGKAGGQHKVPRMDGSGSLTAELAEWFTANGLVA
jgi:hypothetical protein